ncbi:hypothetical protein [Radicibacter daui]|uniref:hypothetical protein n=1 Tax=Radicibacter daui TaxID=3064829 RepID=UPI00404692FD
MATALTVRNPVIYAYHRLALGPLRDLLHPDGSRIRVTGDLMVARSSLELVNYVERGSDLVLVEDSYSQMEVVRALSHTVSELMTTIETVMDRVQRLLKEDPHNEELIDPVVYHPTLQVLAERMMSFTKTLDGAGMVRMLNEFPFSGKAIGAIRSGIVPVVAAVPVAEDRLVQELVDLGVKGIIAPGQSRGDGLDVLYKALEGRPARPASDADEEHEHVDRRDRLIHDLLDKPDIVRRVVTGNGKRPHDFRFSVHPALRHLRIDLARVIILRDGGIRLPDGSILTRGSLRREFAHHPTTAELISAIRRGSFRRAPPDK